MRLLRRCHPFTKGHQFHQQFRRRTVNIGPLPDLLRQRLRSSTVALAIASAQPLGLSDGTVHIAFFNGRSLLVQLGGCFVNRPFPVVSRSFFCFHFKLRLPVLRICFNIRSRCRRSGIGVGVYIASLTSSIGLQCRRQASLSLFVACPRRRPYVRKRSGACSSISLLVGDDEETIRGPHVNLLRSTMRISSMLTFLRRARQCRGSRQCQE